MNNTYTIISRQDTYTKYDRCSGFDGAFDGGFKQEWFNDYNEAINYYADLLVEDKHVIPNQDNPYAYEHTLYINGKSTSISWNQLNNNEQERSALTDIEEAFFRDADELYITKSHNYLINKENERLAKERKSREALELKKQADEEAKRESDLKTLARLKEQYEGKGA